MIIAKYVREVLMPQLKEVGLNDERVLKVVLDDVDLRLRSVLSHWGEPTVQKTLLLLGAEEAPLYAPYTSPLSVRALVVVAIRNSLIEDLHGSVPSVPGLPRVITDLSMPWLTRKAVTYWSEANLDRLKVALPEHDITDQIRTESPAAWLALSVMANCRTYEASYQPVAAHPIAWLLDCLTVAELSRSLVGVSGIDERIDPALARVLSRIRGSERVFLPAPSHKGISRNPVKLLRVIEFILACRGTFLTPNLLISNGYVARRKNFLPPPVNTGRAYIAALGNCSGLAAKHDEALQRVLHSINR